MLKLSGGCHGSGWVVGGRGGGHPVGAGVTLVLLLDGLAVYFAMCIYEGGGGGGRPLTLAKFRF